MTRPHLTTGGRYPALRALAILYTVGAAGVLVYGLYRVGRAFFYPGPWLTERLVMILEAFALTAAVVVSCLMMVELIKLLIDVEHNTRPTAGAAAVAPTIDAPDAESAEAALLRGH